VQWPTYGYDIQRTHLAPDWRNLRPPYHGLWKLKAHADIEFPPSVAYRKVYVAQQKGRFYAINARTGKIVWTKHFPNCSAASPTIADGIVYQAYMHELPCQKHAARAEGFVIAWNAKNGRELWRVRAGSVESSPLLVGKMLYFGSWDRHLYAYRIRGERRPPPVDVQRRRSDRRRSGECREPRDRRDLERERLRRGPEDRPRALACDVVLSLRQPRVLLRHAHGRVRASLHRQR
jgi:hypothetical protein